MKNVRIEGNIIYLNNWVAFVYTPNAFLTRPFLCDHRCAGRKQPDSWCSFYKEYTKIWPSNKCLERNKKELEFVQAMLEL